MKRVVFILLLAGLLMTLHITSLNRAAALHKSTISSAGKTTVLPGSILKVLALEFDGLVADSLFLQAMVFIGETQEREDVPRIKYSELIWFSELLKSATDLDPYFYDLYYFGTAHLTWNEYTGKRRLPSWQETVSYATSFLVSDYLGGTAPPRDDRSVANAGNMLLRDDYLLLQNIDLLDKGSSFRTWDSTLPYYNGFIHFFFYDANDKASEYLMEASRRQEDPTYLASLAARLAYKGNKTENAVIFLAQMLETTTDENLRGMYTVRLEALKRIYFLETRIVAFREKYGRTPVSLQELMSSGIAAYIPEDPYGGKFYLDKDGTIKTSSNLIQ